MNVSVTTKRTSVRTLHGLLFVAWFAMPLAHTLAENSFVSFGDAGRLEYRRDERGNRLPDFSHCGYRGANRDVPNVVPRIVVSPYAPDDSKQIKAAIDYVAQLTANENGWRAAVLLILGEYNVSGQLRIQTSGVVLRGHGAGENGTTLRATGLDRRSLIRVFPGKHEEMVHVHDRTFKIIDDYVPVGANSVRLNSTEGLSVGAQVQVTHPSSSAWIETLEIDRLGWREGTRDIRWLRTITAISENRIELDVPLTLAIDKTNCQATVQLVDDSNRLNEVGIEDLALVSEFNQKNPKDEDHAWYGVHLQGVRDAWVRRVQFRHFAGGAVMLGDEASRITVSDCASFDPVSEIGGYRRHTYFTLGQQCLFLRCWTENGLHDF